MILIGAFIGLLLDLEEYKRYCFAGLAGIFLYTSLCSIFPVINDTLNECRQATQEMENLSEEDAQNLKNKVFSGFRAGLLSTLGTFTYFHCELWLLHGFSYHGASGKCTFKCIIYVVFRFGSKKRL